VDARSFAGSIPVINPGTGFQFAGPRATVTVAAGQKLYVSATAVLGASAQALADLVPCYAVPGSAVNLFSGNYLSVAVLERTSQSSSLTASPAAGTYEVGLCVRATGANPLNGNDFVNGTVLVLR
jgi:hypothetical protein